MGVQGLPVRKMNRPSLEHKQSAMRARMTQPRNTSRRGNITILSDTEDKTMVKAVLAYEANEAARIS